MHVNKYRWTCLANSGIGWKWVLMVQLKQVQTQLVVVVWLGTCLAAVSMVLPKPIGPFSVEC